MALRSVVLEPAGGVPASRRTVVVRAGGPAPKGRILDVIVGILGVLVLLIAVALAQVLPDKTFLNPQFRLSFPETSFEGPGTQREPFTEADGGNRKEFAYEAEHDNIKSITLQLFFREDLSYSLPDTFYVELWAPNGTLVGSRFTATNRLVEPPANATQAPLFFDFSAAPAYTIAPTPSEQIVTGLTHTELPEQALARLEPQYRVATKGTWTIKVEMVSAGDCPLPNEGYGPQQGYYCRFGSPTGEGEAKGDGVDLGNDFAISNFLYTYYTPEITELK